MATDLNAEFDKAAKDLRALTERPSDAELLELYGLYKQATAGNASGARPDAFDFKGRAKYDAWARHRGMSRKAAMQAYIARVSKLRV